VSVFDHIFDGGVGDAAWWSQHCTVIEDVAGGFCVSTRSFRLGQDPFCRAGSQTRGSRGHFVRPTML